MREFWILNYTFFDEVEFEERPELYKKTLNSNVETY